MTTRWLATGLLGLAVALAACSGGPTLPEDGERLLAAILPANGTTGVSPGTLIVLDFTHAMMPGMEQYVAVHEGDANGPVVGGQWSWSVDYRKLTFSPSVPLKSQTRYTVHMGMGMMNSDGTMTGDHAQHHTASCGAHMGSGMSGGMTGGGGMMGSSMKSCGWLTSFTTA